MQQSITITSSELLNGSAVFYYFALFDTLGFDKINNPLTKENKNLVD